jgi:precorrin-3B methylase
LKSITGVRNVMAKGTLTIVGTGIAYWGQFTQEARTHIQHADKVLYLVADVLTSHDIQAANPTAESLYKFYGARKQRLTSYLEMAEHIVSFVRSGLNVCAVFYGHPGVFVFPSHEAIARARREGFDARMLPGISAEDCLFADLGVDPGRMGCQSFEATDFLVHKKRFDNTSILVLWQIGVIGIIDHQMPNTNKGLTHLARCLAETYGEDHPVVVYEAAQYPVCDSTMQTVKIRDLPAAKTTAFSTLYVPPKAPATPDIDTLLALGIPKSYARRRDEIDAASDVFRFAAEPG